MRGTKRTMQSSLQRENPSLCGSPVGADAVAVVCLSPENAHLCVLPVGVLSERYVSLMSPPSVSLSRL